MRRWEYRAEATDADKRLSQLLYARFHLTRRQISRLKFQEGGICVNGEPCRTDHRVQSGDRIVLTLDQPPSQLETPPFHVPLCILYENTDLIAVHKPSGMAFHPGHGHYYDTLSVQLDHQLKQEGRGTRLHAVGRLDKDTSGIALFAKHPISAQRLHAQLRDGQLKKTYRAIAHGSTPPAGTISTPIQRKAGVLNQMEIHPDGKSAVTRYKCLRSSANHSLLQLQLESGRTHQIRVHMQSIGHPLAGDVIYGYADSCPRLALHAWMLRFHDPFREETIVLTDTDDSFEALIRRLFQTETTEETA